jgi:hypothetical protein
MENHFETADIVIGVLASLGVLVLIYVFFWVYRQVFSKEKEE